MFGREADKDTPRSYALTQFPSYQFEETTFDRVSIHSICTPQQQYLRRGVFLLSREWLQKLSLADRRVAECGDLGQGERLLVAKR